MQKVKYVFWLIVIAVVGVFIYQNSQIFTAHYSLGIDLKIFKYDSPELPAGVFYLSAFLIGLLISYFLSLSQKFRNRKTIRQLNQQIADLEKKNAELQSELASKPQSYSADAPAEGEAKEASA